MKRLSLRRLILREMDQSRLNTALCFLCVVVATALLVTMMGISRASIDATRKMMKEMGFNLLITPAGVDPARYQALDFQDVDMPESHIGELAARTALAQHMVGKYQKTIQIDGRTLVLTGVRGEVTKHGTTKAPMPTAYTVPAGEVYLGSAAAPALGLMPGDTLEILGREFTVGKVLPEKGLIPDDIRIFAALADVQALLGKEGRVNAIDALACYCPVPAGQILTALETTIKNAIPDVEVKPYKSILQARQAQREMMYRLELAALTIVLVASAAAIWALTYQNVRSRRREIGVLQALGVGAVRIGGLFVGKIVAYSAAGAGVGIGLGFVAAATLPVAEGAVTFPAGALLGIFFATPLVAVLFGMPPIMAGLVAEPARVLGEREA